MDVEQKKPNILFVDDKESEREIFRLTFSQVAKVTVARNSEEALGLLAGQDMALVDLKLGPENGLAVAQTIRERYPGLLLRLMTCLPVSEYDSPDTDIQCIEKNVDSDLMVRAILNLWRLENLKGGYRENRDKILQLLPFKNRIRRVYRAQIPGLESLIGRPLGCQDEAKWVIYRDPKHPKVIRIGITCTMGCIGGCPMCFSGKTRPLKKKYGPSIIISQVLLALESMRRRAI
ncbi:MAG: hypothetical protein Q8O93_00650 [bacterium]|nr:hypothetical protein [bacterium]